jgi:hypothetical protein
LQECKNKANIKIKNRHNKKEGKIKAHFMLCKTIFCKAQNQIQTKPLKKVVEKET